MVVATPGVSVVVKGAGLDVLKYDIRVWDGVGMPVVSMIVSPGVELSSG